jgi:hypothetical protein
MKDFVRQERNRAVTWKITTPTLPDVARRPAAYIGKNGAATTGPLPFCLPAEHAKLNLLPEVRDKALEIFADRHIPWHASVAGGPSNHLLSSQVQCANALTGMVDEPARVQRAFGGELDIAEVTEIEPNRHLTFEYVAPQDYFGESVDGVLTPGANCTSVDAAFRYIDSSGGTHLALVEWKYTEHYSGKVDRPHRTFVRRARYERAFSAGDGWLRDDLVDLEVLFAEPLYQLLRQQLLAQELERAGVAETVTVLHVLDPANEAYQRSLLAPALLEIGSTVDEVWQSLLRRPERFAHVNPAVFLDPAITSSQYVARYG